MTTRIKSDQDFYTKNESDITGNSNTGETSGSATRLANINPDIGLAESLTSIDGDLRSIDTASERLSLNPAANTSGNATNRHSTNFLSRWIAGLIQDILNRIPAALGQSTMANSFRVVLPSDQSPLSTRPSVPYASSVTILSAQTNATGTNWTAFGSAVCTAIDITNNTGIDIEYRRNGAGTTYPIPAKTARLIIGISNANQIEIRRIDQNNNQITIYAEAIAV